MENGVANLAKEEYFGLDINENTIGPTNIYHIETCSLLSLTVFKDRAELCRCVKPQLKVGKISMIVFKKISPVVDRDSFRVDVKGPGVIRDVYFRAVSIPDDEKALAENKQQLEKDIAACNKKLKLLASKQQRLKTQKSVIDGFSETLVEKRDSDFKSKTSMFDPKHMETLSSFLSLYENQVEKLDQDLMQTQEEIDGTQQKLEEYTKELEKLDQNNNEKLSRELTIMLECKDTEPVTLSVNYILFSCQWTPSYDIRIYSNDGNMKILYYGQITQTTGEDWFPETMFLSTALPGIGEHAPELAGQSIRFKDVRRRPPKISKSKRMTKALSFHSKEESIRMTSSPRSTAQPIAEDAYMCFSDDNTRDYDALKSPTRDFNSILATPLHGTAQMNGSMGPSDKEDSLNKDNNVLIQPTIPTITKTSSSISTTTPSMPVVHFTVSRPPTICTSNVTYGINFSPFTSKLNRQESINNSSQLPETCQRALVGIIDLHPSFDYVAVPRRTPHAFLKANCHNGSSYAILPGTANVFIDNNFIGKTTLGTVAPQEEFKCDLGVDQGVKINYRPIYKYKETNTSSNSRHNGVTFKQLIEIKNNHERNIRLLVKDQLPISGEDKIKIHLQDPVIKHGYGIVNTMSSSVSGTSTSDKSSDKNKQIKMTKSGIIEWNLELHPNEFKELTLKYLVEYPINEEIDVAFMNPVDL